MEKLWCCMKTETLGQRDEHWTCSPFPTMTEKGVIGMVHNWRWWTRWACSMLWELLCVYKDSDRKMTNEAFKFKSIGWMGAKEGLGMIGEWVELFVYGLQKCWVVGWKRCVGRYQLDFLEWYLHSAIVEND